MMMMIVVVVFIIVKFDKPHRMKKKILFCIIYFSSWSLEVVRGRGRNFWVAAADNVGVNLDYSVVLFSSSRDCEGVLSLPTL